MHLMQRTLLLLVCCCGVLAIVVNGDDTPEEAPFRDATKKKLQSDGSTKGQVVATGRLQIGLAKKLLQKWGYMQTQQEDGHWDFVDWRKQIDNPAVSMFSETFKTFKSFEDDENAWSYTEKSKFHDGVSSFQKKFNLPVTGELDTDTLGLMQQPRCAVPDNVDLSYEEGITGEAVKDKDMRIKVSNSKANGGLVQKLVKSSKESMQDFVSVVKDSKIFTNSKDRKNKDVQRTTTVASAIKNTTPSLTTILRGEALRSRTPEPSTEITEVISDFSEDITTVASSISDDNTHEERRRRNAIETLPIVNRSKRTISHTCTTGYTTSRAITWRILKKNSGSNQLSDSNYFTSTSLRSTMTDAFRRWAEVSRLSFEEKNDGSSSSVDIWIQFVTDGTDTVPYGCGYYVYCFFSSEIAASFHSYVYSNGQYSRRTYIYFRDDPSRPWARGSYSNTVDLLTAAVHEIGHILCLDHDSSSTSAVMNPYASIYLPNSNLEVPIDSVARQDMKTKYGACDDPFVAFDWVRTVNGQKKFSTYMFRDDHYWLWENSNKQTRYADPIVSRSSSEWPNVPSNLQAVVQILPKGSSLNLLYFFADGNSYLYDQDRKMVVQQGRISSMWPAKPGSSTSIPNNIRAAYYDKRDGNVYFFTSTLVYVYDYASSSKGCCNSVQTISSAFPARYGGAGLENNIDLAYYSITDRKMYFLKGAHYWESTYNTRDTYVSNRVYPKQYNWHEKWQYICDV